MSIKQAVNDPLLGKKINRLNDQKGSIMSDEIRRQQKSINNSEIKQNNSERKDNKSEIKDKKGKKKQNQFTSILKVFNIFLGVILIGLAAYFYYGIQEREEEDFELMRYIMPGYIGISGLIILAIQMHIKFICRNMKFLYNYLGRGLFNIYIGVMPLTLLDTTPSSKQSQIQQVLIYVLVSLLLFVGILYIVSKVFCCAKEGSKKQKKKYNQTDSSSD